MIYLYTAHWMEKYQKHFFYDTINKFMYESYSHLIISSENIIYATGVYDGDKYHQNMPVIENYNIITIDDDDDDGIMYDIANNYLEKLIFDKL